MTRHRALTPSLQESDGGTPEESDTPDAPPALTQGQRRTIIDDDEEDDDHEPEDWGQVRARGRRPGAFWVARLQTHGGPGSSRGPIA